MAGVVYHDENYVVEMIFHFYPFRASNHLSKSGGMNTKGIFLIKVTSYLVCYGKRRNTQGMRLLVRFLEISYAKNEKKY
jgi:hypothetical protein